jgi:hypothetical protein
MRQGSWSSLTTLGHAALVTAALACPAFGQSPIEIVSPSPDEFVDARLPFTVRWEAPDIPGNAGFVVYYVQAAEQRPICNAPSTARECVWADPPAPRDFSGTLFVEARSAAGNVLAVTESELFYLHEGFLPNPWTGNVDVGDVGVPGSAARNEDDTTIVLSGSGHGIEGITDAYQYLFTQIIGGDAVNLRATITSIDGPRGTKVGLMVGGGTPGAANDVLAITRDGVALYQHRFDDDGATVRTVVSTRATLPIEIELIRRGHTELNVLVDGEWRRAGRSILGTGLLGFAITSGRRNVLATAVLENVRSDTDSFPAFTGLSPFNGEEFVAGEPIPITWTQREPHAVTVSYSLDNAETWTPVRGCVAIMANSCTWHNPRESEAARIRVDYVNSDDRTTWISSFAFVIRPGALRPLPDPWHSRDVGGVATAGFATFSQGPRLFAVGGSGAGIAGNADEFHFVSRRLVERRGHAVEVTARVASTELSFGPAQAGIMVRAIGGAGAPHVSVLVPTSPFSRVLPLSFVRRASKGGETAAIIGPAVGEPVWIRLRIDDGTVRAFYREAANAPWRFLGQTRVALGARFDVGFAVTSVADGSLTRATFDRVAIEYVRLE